MTEKEEGLVDGEVKKEAGGRKTAAKKVSGKKKVGEKEGETGVVEKKKTVKAVGKKKSATTEIGAGEKKAVRGRKKVLAAGARKKTGPGSSGVVGEVQAVLLELMKASASDSVRVAAAKALMDRVRDYEGDADDGTGREEEDRASAVAEARDLLGALAEALSCRVSGAVAVDVDGAARTDHAEGDVADLGDPCGTRLGKDADGG